MPRMDGFEFSRELGKNPEWAGIPVIIISGVDITPADRQRLNGNIDRVLRKGSLSQADLMAEIRRAVVSNRSAA